LSNLLLLSREPDDEVHGGKEARLATQLDRAHDVLDRVAAGHGAEQTVRAGLRAEEHFAVVRPAQDERERLPGDVLGPQQEK
jgi:hypothetical protein